MSYDAILIFDEKIIRQAVFGFWRRSVGTGFFVALVFVAGGLGLTAVQGADSWFVGAGGSVLVIGIAFAVVLYVVHYRASLRKLREMGSLQATFRADESTFTITSDIGTATLQWSAVKELWQFSTVWLLLYSKAQFNTLPLSCISPEMQAFIVQRVKAAGGKIAG